MTLGVNCTVTVASGNTTLQSAIVRTMNPFRYRGYYYDNETGFYYLQSRYYDPANGRFINADGYINANGDLIGYNMYAYCSNNPVMNTDPTGESILATILIGALVGAVVSVASQVVSDVVVSVSSGELYYSSWPTYAGAAVGGAVGGVLLAFTGSQTLSNVVSSAVATMTTMGLENASGEAEHTAIDFISETIDSSFSSLILGKIIPETKVNNVTRGLNSYKSVFNSGMTKLTHGTANTMSKNVLAKGAWSGVVGGIYSSIASGVLTHTKDFFEW